MLASTCDFERVVAERDLPANWRLKGTLVAHLHEHKSAITKMTSLTPNGPVFASASTDGTIRLWDCNKMDGYQSINRSRQMYVGNTPIYSIAACQGGQSLLAAGKDENVMLVRVDLNSSKMALQEAKPLKELGSKCGEFDDGPVVDMVALDHGSQSLVCFATLYGAIICWDLRMPTGAWRLKTALRYGVITTFCADTTSSWLATGTSGGKHICWDLRFRLPIGKRNLFYLFIIDRYLHV